MVILYLQNIGVKRVIATFFLKVRDHLVSALSYKALIILIGKAEFEINCNVLSFGYSCIFSEVMSGLAMLVQLSIMCGAQQGHVSRSCIWMENSQLTRFSSKLQKGGA